MSTETRSTCPYCGVGCGVIIESSAGEITGVKGDPAHPANFGRLCSKGSTLHLTATPLIRQTQRLLQPAWRPSRGAAPEALSWEALNQRLAQRIAAVHAEYGPDAIGLYISGQLLTEDYQAFNKLARGLLGTNNIDSNSRLCMSSAVAGYKQALGADAPPACYQDIEQADCVFISGANPAWAHPILFRRLEDAKAQRPELKLIVVDPRRTESAELADLHLQILPGTDVALMHGLLHACIWEGWLDADFMARHTQGFDALKTLVRSSTPKDAARICGIQEADLLTAARWFAQSPATLSLYCQGLNQSSSGTAKNTALINLHLACGQIGRPGAGPFSLTGQPNAMGGREVGGMASLLAGPPRARQCRASCRDRPPVGRGRPARNAGQDGSGAVRGRRQWRDQGAVDRLHQPGPVHARPGPGAACAGPLRAGDLARSLCRHRHRRPSPMCCCRLPPGAKRKARSPIASAASVAYVPRLHRRARPDPTGKSCAIWPAGLPPCWASPIACPTPAPKTCGWSTAPPPSAVTSISAASTGPSWTATARSNGLTRPVLSRARPGSIWTAYSPAPMAAPASSVRPTVLPVDKLDARFPLALTTGRLRDQWHGMSRSGLLPRLFGHEPVPALRLHPQDLPLRGLKDGELALISSRHGQLILPVCADPLMPPAQAYLAMHWGEEFVSGRNREGTGSGKEDGQVWPGVNALLGKQCCPDSKQPELKFAAIQVKAVALPWRLSAAIWCTPSEAVPLRARLRALMGEFDYASCLPVAGVTPDQIGWCFDVATRRAPSTCAAEPAAHAAGFAWRSGTELCRQPSPTQPPAGSGSLGRSSAPACPAAGRWGRDG